MYKNICIIGKLQSFLMRLCVHFILLLIVVNTLIELFYFFFNVGLNVSLHKRQTKCVEHQKKNTDLS